MSDISVKRALAIPLLLLAVMLATAAGLSLFTGVSGSRVFLPYLSAWSASTLIAMLVWVFVEVARLVPARADRPLQVTVGRLPERQKLFALPALIFPTFLGAYTWAKVSIPFAVGYGWEARWADIDHAILGRDAWVLAHALSPPQLAHAWTFFYAVIWGFALIFSSALITAFATRRFAATFFAALMLSWLIGGVAMAYLLSAAGPVFAHLADPTFVERFAPLRAELINLLGNDNVVLRSQHYLAAGVNMRVALKGGGISAMPSMHIATATTCLLAARGSRWFWLALLFLMLTFFGSVYLGYHYVVDAPVAAAVAIACWGIAQSIYGKPANARPTRETAQLGTAAAATAGEV